MRPHDASEPTSPAPDPPFPGPSGEELATRYWERLRLFAARRLGSVDAAEDVAQETLRHVSEALRAGRLREPAALPGFVFQTALHLCLQQLRASGREARGLVRLAAAAQENETRDALATLIAEERCREVHRALARLRADDRELLRQLYFLDLDPDSIARQSGVTSGALRVRKHRALLRLAQLVNRTDA
jgi:RNA polymerase sigma factor (sigma-70 family)